MAENDELKKIAELTFGTKGIKSSLNEAEKDLNAWIKKIKSNQLKQLQNDFTNSFTIDEKAVKKAGEINGKVQAIMQNNANISKSKQESLQAQLTKITTKGEEDRLTAAYKAQLKQEANDQKRIASTKTMYDKIANMANTYLTYQGFNALKHAAQEVVDEMVNVESQMVQIDRVLNEDSLNIDKYRDKLIALAHDYGNSFDNVADITLRLAQAGFDSQQSIALTEKTLLALNTAELNATQATDDMIAVMSQWNLMTGSATEIADDYASIIDKVNRVADNFPTTSADIMDALKKTSSAFNMAGASIDETIASIVAAEKASQRGGKAIGTALNSIVQQLKTDKRLSTMEGLGIDLYTDETKTEFKSIMEIFEQLSNKMEQLKREGKESSVEMQNLLSVFTVLRRNIGGAFLGEMSGGDSTYNQVLELVQAYDTMGYSIQENEKYMKTAKAAQEQFNAALLQLKTAVWENGAEDVFRGLLALGTDVVKVFTTLIKYFGTLPTTLGMVTLAFTLFNKQLQLVKINEAGSGVELAGFIAKLKGATTQVAGTTTALKGATAATTALKIETMALNAVWSLGLSLVITGVLSLFDELIHKEEKARQKQQEIIDSANETIEKNQQEATTLEKLIEDYEKYSNIQGPLKSEDREEFEKTQKAVSEYLIQNNKYTAEMKGNYDLQLEALKQINEEIRKRNLQEAQGALEAAKRNRSGIDTNAFYDALNTKLTSLQNAGIDLEEYLGKGFGGLKAFENLDFDTQLEALTKWKEQLQETGQVGSEAYTWVAENLKTLEEQQGEVETQTNRINELLRETALEDFLDSHDIQTAEDYKKALEDIANLELPEGYIGDLEDFRSIMQQLVENIFPAYSNGIEEIGQYTADYLGAINEEVGTLETLSNQYTALTTAANEYNSSGQLTVATFKSLVDNDLLQYLDLVNGKLQFNGSELITAADAAKAKAVSDMQAEAAAEILSIAQADLSGALEATVPAADASAGASQKAGNAALNAAQDFVKGTIAVQQFNAALNNSGYNGNLSKQAIADINAVTSRLQKNIAAINSISLSAAKSSGGASRGATKTFKDESAERVKTFKQEISDLESLEQQWVNKYKKLELFGTSDLKFITHQRINRYNEYLNQINQLQGISEKDRTTLIKEYTAERQKLELEYFDLLKQQLDDQIKQLQEANKEKIQLIKDEAQARIDSLKQVEDENDRIRQKEEYEAKRQELLHGYQGVEYWKQRTGREAQLALAEAEQKLAELDQDWEDKKKDWTLEDQIEEIEKARDAQIKAIEDAQEQQIAGWKAAYQAQVNLYAETGQIIYDDSIINAGYLYNAYMDNFVNPLNMQLQTVISSLSTANSIADDVSTKMNSIANRGGPTGDISNMVNNALGTSNQQAKSSTLLTSTRDSVSSTPANYSNLSSNKITPITSPTLLDKVTSAARTAAVNIGNKILTTYKKITGRFHGGGMVNTNAPEALAILRPKEVVLTPEWAAGMNKLVKQVNEGKLLTQGTSSTTQIDVNGNLVNIDADIKNKQDADYLTKQITKVLEDKFNIRK